MQLQPPQAQMQPRPQQPTDQQARPNRLSVMVQILALMSSKNECEVELARLRGVLNANQAGMGPAHADPVGAQSCAVLEAALVLYDKALAPLLAMQNA
jgi:hypothetical protein